VSKVNEVRVLRREQGRYRGALGTRGNRREGIQKRRVPRAGAEKMFAEKFRRDMVPENNSARKMAMAFAEGVFCSIICTANINNMGLERCGFYKSN
jgi:hypothetical protein